MSVFAEKVLFAAEQLSICPGSTAHGAKHTLRTHTCVITRVRHNYRHTVHTRYFWRKFSSNIRPHTACIYSLANSSQHSHAWSLHTWKGHLLIGQHTFSQDRTPSHRRVHLLTGEHTFSQDSTPSQGSTHVYRTAQPSHRRAHLLTGEFTFSQESTPSHRRAHLFTGEHTFTEQHTCVQDSTTFSQESTPS